jgi:hypothetical protein
MCHFPLLIRRGAGPKTLYNNVPYISNILFTDPDLCPVDTQYTPHGIIVIGHNSINAYKHPAPLAPSTLQDLFNSLPSSLNNIVGKLNNPYDNGSGMLPSVSGNSPYRLFGASDASYKDGRASHAWFYHLAPLTIS